MEVDNGNDKGGKVVEDNLDVSDLNVKIDEDGKVVENDDIDPSDSEEALRRSIEESYSSTPAKSDTGKKKDEKIELTIEEEKFFDGDEDALDNLVRDPKAFNGLLNKIFKKAAETGHNLAVENIMRSAPEIVKVQVAQHVALQTAVSKFYSDNQDLIPYKGTVGAIAAKIANENPNLPLDKLLSAAETVARKRLSLVKSASKKDESSARFPKKPTGDRGGKKEDLTGVASEIDAMLKAL